METIGSGAVTASFNESKHSDVIVVIGAQPTTNHPVAATFLKNARKNGATLIVLDPRGSPLTRHADYWLQFKPGSDVALLNAANGLTGNASVGEEQYGWYGEEPRRKDRAASTVSGSRSPAPPGGSGRRTGARMSDPRTYDYSQPTLACDVVMKGGITSGVVYPHALCELARTYRFVDVGGTSAGAIAAAAAAAAEHGRDSDGFAKLAELPAWIGGDGNLFRLFQPQGGTTPFFRLFTAGLGQTGAGKWLRVAAAALRS